MIYWTEIYSKIFISRYFVTQFNNNFFFFSCLKTPRENLSEEDLEMVDMARAGAKALWSLSASRHNKEIMRKSGLVPLMGRLLKSIHIDVVVPIMGTVAECATQGNYQLAITTEGMIQDIVNHLNCSNFDLKLQCSSAIFKCASDPVRF